MSLGLPILLNNYTLTVKIGETAHSIIYRGVRNDTKETVVVKTLKTSQTLAAQAAKIKHEYDMIRGLQIDGIVRTIDFIDQNGILGFVLEDFGGVSLKTVIQTGLPLDRFLKLAIRLAEIVGKLHQAKITHRDIKPHNILLNPENDTVKITDFGIAAETLPIDQEMVNPAAMEGTLPYIAPEQTGRMNCVVDYRADLYSLGVTFYEMLTGQVPFRAQSPVEIIHAHIARMPVEPCGINPNVPVPVSDIIMKLLSKSADDRYQNGFGLAADLRECLKQFQLTGQIKPFALGGQDVSPRFLIPHVLVGREKERYMLLEAVERASQGQKEVLMITGEAGIGKTSLVSELSKTLIGKQGYFISGKFDQFRTNVPLSAIIQAFRGLVLQLLTQDPQPLDALKEKLLAALGPNGKIITDTIPDMALILGDQPDIPDLPPEEKHNRFMLCFKNFVGVFAQANHPLVIFLDDLQWADEASLHLLERLATDRDLRHILFIGAYRETECSLDHPLFRVIQTITASGTELNTLCLKSLDPEAVNILLRSMLNCPAEVSLPLARIVREKTKGNPFFVHQFLKTLHDERHIQFDSVSGWSWDLQKIRLLQVTENVVWFMTEKLYRLPDDHLEIVKICACIGNRFDLDTLALISRRPVSDILSIMDHLIQEGLIIDAGDLYRFQHNRIQEAAYQLLDPGQREKIHYEIGTRAFYAAGSEKLPNRLFYICDHLNSAHRCLTTPQERKRLAELNLKAGIKAEDASAYEAAAGYFECGIELIGPNGWRDAYDLAYPLFSELMECRYLMRNFAEAERLFNVLITSAASKPDQARAFTTMIKLYTTIGPPKDAVELGLTALKIFNLHLKIDMGRGPVIREWIKAAYLLKKTGIDAVVNLPRMQDKHLLAAHELMLHLGHPAYYMNKNLIAFMALRGVTDSLRHGLVPHAGIAFIGMANILQNEFGNYELAYRLGLTALKLDDRLDAVKTKGAVLHNFAYFIQHWKKHLRHNLEIYLKVYELAMNTGDFIYAGHSVNAVAETRLFLDHRLDDVMEELKKHQTFMLESKNKIITDEYRQIVQFILALKGLTPARHDLSGNGLDLDSCLEQARAQGNAHGLCLGLYHKMVLLYFYRRYEEALQAAEEFDRHSKVFQGTHLLARYLFFFSLTMLALIREGDKRQRRFRSLIRRHLRLFEKWAHLCPENFRPMYTLILAELAGVEGRFRKAVDLYHAAINDAHNHDFLPIEAVACELLGTFYIRWNHPAEAGVFLRRARNGYTFWGATAKEQDLQERYPDFLRQDNAVKPSDKDTRSATSESSSHTLDFSTVMEVARVISSEIRLENLLGKTMHLSITSAGAQRGYLMLVSADGRLLIQASEDVLTGESRVLQSIALDECPDISSSIVHYVHRSASPLILGNAALDAHFRNDPHIVEKRCKSILCLPVFSQAAVVAVLYMENNLTTDAFTAEHLKILQIISAQAAISLQNARLYEDLTAEINARKKTEEALRRSEEQYRTILEEMQDIYSETDLDGTITFVNPALCHLTGYTKDELIGSSIRIFTAPEDFKRLERYYRRSSYENARAGLFTADILGKDGTVTCMENMVSPIRDKAGKIVGYRNLGRDITERKRLERNLLESYQKMQNVRIATILGLAKLAEYRDEATGAHLERIREYAKILAQELSTKPEYHGYITPEYIEDIYHSSILHDIGKVGIPDAILLKPGKLTPDEFEIIKIHTTLGGDVLKAVEGKIEGQSFLTLGKEIAYFHHEKWDGSGYPHGLSGDAIPLSARIVALADVYDALTSKRVYKEAFPHLQAVDIIVKNRGTHFAPDVVDAFMVHAEDFRKIREELLRDDHRPPLAGAVDVLPMPGVSLSRKFLP